MVLKSLKTKYKYFIFAAILFLLGTMFLYAVPREGAEAARPKVLTVEQAAEAEFCGEWFLETVDGAYRFADTDAYKRGFNNPLFEALVFKLDDVEIDDLSYENVTVETTENIYRPGRYICGLTVDYEEETYTINTVPLIVSQRLVTVLTLLNGKVEETVNEGEKVLLSYDYQNAVPAHTKEAIYNGVKVTEILPEYLISPAWTDVDTTRPIENCPVVAAHAQSEYYRFNYTASVLTIIASTVTQLTFADSKATQLIMMGNFSVLNGVKYTDVGVNLAEERYAVISAKADTLYKASGFFDKYEKVGCFSIEVFYNNNPVVQSIPAKVLVRNTTLDESKTYKIIALYNNGNYDVVNTAFSDGYLTFSAADAGDFIIVTEIEGLSLTYYVLVIAAGIGVLVLVVLLVAVFRRKY